MVSLPSLAHKVHHNLSYDLTLEFEETWEERGESITESGPNSGSMTGFKHGCGKVFAKGVKSFKKGAYCFPPDNNLERDASGESFSGSSHVVTEGSPIPSDLLKPTKPPHNDKMVP
eukprot:197788-Ditylum_brightwellii.AAC.1